MMLSGYIYLPYGFKKGLLRSADGDVVGARNISGEKNQIQGIRFYSWYVSLTTIIDYHFMYINNNHYVSA